MSFKPLLSAALCLAAMPFVAGAADAQPSAGFRTGAIAMATLSLDVNDTCAETDTTRVSALGVWLDGRYEQELLLFPASGRERYDALLGPLERGRHRVDLRPSALWPASPCVRALRTRVSVVEADAPGHLRLRHAPVLEIRADTVGEQTDVPLFEYVETDGGDAARRLRYTVVFSNEDGGTPTRALLARWGRTTDIEQVYEVGFEGASVVREEFQGPDHEIRRFAGRRRGVAPVLLVATLNNMVTDRGRGIAAVRPVPEAVDLSHATRESTLDARSWAYRVMARELAAEAHVSSDAGEEEGWLRRAPDPREHVYVEARLTLDRAVAAAWVRDRDGRRFTSHYDHPSLAIDRNGWVRVAVAVGPKAGSRVEELGWLCLPARGSDGQGSCVIEAVRAFAFGDDWAPGPNLVAPTMLQLRAGEEGRIRN